MPCFLRPPVLPDGNTSTDYTPMSDVSGQEQNNFQGAPVMGWTSPSSAVDSNSTANVVKTDVHHRVGSLSHKPYLESVEFNGPAAPQLPPRADARLRDSKSHRKMPRSILLWQSLDENTDKVDAKPYAVIQVGQLPTEPKTKSPTTISDSSVNSLNRQRAPHIYDEIVYEANSTEMEGKQKEEPVTGQVSRLESEESPYAEPNNYDDDDEVEMPSCEVTPPPLPPRAPSMTPPCSPKLIINCSPEPTSCDEYVEPDVIDNIKPNRSLSAPPSQLISQLDDLNSKNNSTNYPVSPPKSPPKSPKATKEKRSKKGSTLYNLLRTFKKKSQAETANVTRILPEHIPSEEVSLFQDSVNKYNLDLPNVAEDAGSELQRRLSGKCRHGSRQGTLTRHRSLSPLDAYVDMHPESRPLSDCDYYEPMKLQELRQQFMSSEYDVPYSSPSPSPAPEEETTDNTGSTVNNNAIDNTTLRRSKSESSISMEEPNRTSTLGLTLLTQLSQSTECVLNDEVSENCDDTVSVAKSVDHVDSDAVVEIKKPTTPPRPKPPIGPKPQIKPKPSLPPKPNNTLITRPPISPRTKLPSQNSVPKLPPKPTVNKNETLHNGTVTRTPKPAVKKTESTMHNDTVTRTKADIRVPEDIGGNDHKTLKPLGKPPPPPPKAYRSTSFVMVKKPPAAKGLHAVSSATIASSSANKDRSSPTKSPPALIPDTSADDRKKEMVGVVVELKESDDDELEHVEYTVDNSSTTEQALTTSTEVDGTVGIQESPGKKSEC